MPEHADASLALAADALAAARVAGAALDAALAAAGGAPGPCPDAAQLDAQLCEQEFGVAARRGDAAACRALLERAAGLGPALGAARLSAMAQAALRPALRDAGLAASAHRLALQRLLSAAAPDYGRAAATLRECLFLTPAAAAGDEPRLALLREAAALVAGAPSDGGGWPEVELHWLAAHAWNRGCAHAVQERAAVRAAQAGAAPLLSSPPCRRLPLAGRRIARTTCMSMCLTRLPPPQKHNLAACSPPSLRQAAEEFFAVGLDLASRCPQLAPRIPDMRQDFDRLRKAAASAARGGVRAAHATATAAAGP